MQKISLPNTQLTVSKFIFGTGSLIKNIREKKQLYISKINHYFDLVGGTDLVQPKVIQLIDFTNFIHNNITNSLVSELTKSIGLDIFNIYTSLIVQKGYHFEILTKILNSIKSICLVITDNELIFIKKHIKILYDLFYNNTHSENKENNSIRANKCKEIMNSIEECLNKKRDMSPVYAQLNFSDQTKSVKSLLHNPIYEIIPEIPIYSQVQKKLQKSDISLLPPLPPKIQHYKSK